LALDGGEMSVSGSGRFTPGERSTGSLFTRARVGPRACPDAVT